MAKGLLLVVQDLQDLYHSPQWSKFVPGLLPEYPRVDLEIRLLLPYYEQWFL
jgi:hypothetical protein